MSMLLSFKLRTNYSYTAPMVLVAFSAIGLLLGRPMVVLLCQ